VKAAQFRGRTEATREFEWVEHGIKQLQNAVLPIHRFGKNYRSAKGRLCIV
jgi:hypothetical protein